jgi:hypothetical protein
MSCCELWMKIAKLLNYDSLHSLSATSRLMQKFAADAHFELYKALLRCYAFGDIHGLVDAIEQSNGVVIGLGALWVITRTNDWSPRDLNLVVPHKCHLPLHAFLLRVGYDIMDDPPFTNVPSARVEYSIAHRVYAGRQQQECVITVTESADDSVLTMVLAGSATSDMMFVTASGFFCAHPRLTFSAIALQGFPRGIGTLVMHRYIEKGFLVVSSTIDWDRECRSDCPILWRSIHESRHSLLVDWTRVVNDPYSPYRHVDGRDHWWRLDQNCLNRSCRFRWHDIKESRTSPSSPDEITTAKQDLAASPVCTMQYFGCLVEDLIFSCQRSCLVGVVVGCYTL